MKTLKQFINKSLVKSDHINEGLFPLRDYKRVVKSHIVKPKNREELLQIIKDTIEKEGNECDLNFIDISNVTNMSFFFLDITNFNGDISEWDVSNVQSMYKMFYCSKFNGDISEWDVSNVQSMKCMFEDSKFNGDISDWNVSNVKNMYKMFHNSDFNGDISMWDVSNVEDMEGMFSNSKFNGDISDWDVSNVKYMNDMFHDSKFSGDISKWQLKRVRFTRDMFLSSPLQKVYGYTPKISYGKLVKNRFIS